MNKPSIKALAKEAKQRMCEGQNPENKSMLPEQALEEERVYKLVCQLQTIGEVITNPIARVANPDLWKRLQGAERERYVLSLSEVYRKMCARYQSEQGAR